MCGSEGAESHPAQGAKPSAIDASPAPDTRYLVEHEQVSDSRPVLPEVKGFRKVHDGAGAAVRGTVVTVVGVPRLDGVVAGREDWLCKHWRFLPKDALKQASEQGVFHVSVPFR